MHCASGLPSESMRTWRRLGLWTSAAARPMPPPRTWVAFPRCSAVTCDSDWKHEMYSLSASIPHAAAESSESTSQPPGRHAATFCAIAIAQNTAEAVCCSALSSDREAW